jgi:hypothetical protein
MFTVRIIKYNRSIYYLLFSLEIVRGKNEFLNLYDLHKKFLYLHFDLVS